MPSELAIPVSAYSSNSGPMTLFPIMAREKTTVDKSVAYFDPPGIPRLMAIIGRIEGSDERTAYSSMELPIRVPPVAKKQQEIRDITTALRSGLGLSFMDEDVKPGPSPNDPPDVVLAYLGRQWRIETAQVHMPGRRKGNQVSRWMEFATVLDKILDDAPRLKSRLRAHRGHVVYVGFGDQNRPAAAAGPRSDYDEFIQFLATQNPPKVALPAGVPKDAPPGHVVRSEDGRFTLTWARGSTGSLVERMLDFDLGLMYATDATETTLRNEVLRIVRDHDHPANDLLILSIGASTHRGWKFPSSALLADLAFNDSQLTDAMATNYLRSVALFDEDTNRLLWLKGEPPWAKATT